MVKTAINTGKRSCAICRTTWGRNDCIKFFQVPKNDARRRIWIECCGVDLKDSSRLCEKHFLQSDFINAPGDPVAKRTRLMPNAVPKRLCVTNRSVPKVLESPQIKPPRVLPGTKIHTSMQTDDEFSDSNEIMMLRNHIQQLQMKVSNLEKQCQELDCTNMLGAIFTKSQIRKMRNTSKKFIHWPLEDITAAFSLQALGARAYRHLYQKGFPYPCEDTLHKWKRKMKANNQTSTSKC